MPLVKCLIEPEDDFIRRTFYIGMDLKSAIASALVEDRPKHLVLHDLYTEVKYRRRGLAHLVMRHLTEFADKRRRSIHLEAVPEWDEGPQPGVQDLLKLYQTYGFSLTEPPNMVRPPTRRPPGGRSGRAPRP